jgi:hypothetical protein
LGTLNLFGKDTDRLHPRLKLAKVADKLTHVEQSMMSDALKEQDNLE